MNHPARLPHPASGLSANRSSTARTLSVRTLSFRPLTGLAVLTALAVGTQAAPTGLEVHEWGTFTTLNSSAGNPLSGLYVDATRLPDFVSGLPYFNYDLAKGWASLEKLRNVTVKMETPVIYFYSAKQVDVDVKVKFNGGTISQWYPACYDCETDPAAASVDFATEPYSGHVGWKATVLAPGPDLPYTTTAGGKETAEWTAPRYTTANQLRGQKGEIEKFLFYRGLGGFASSVDLRFLPDGRLQVKNVGAEEIPYVMVYERENGTNIGGDAVVWHTGAMKAGAMVLLKRDKSTVMAGGGMNAMEGFHAEMVKAGLTTQEARALLNTWYNGYFIEGGLKAFWILPRAQVDRILPLSIAPAPDKLERVIVGRSEILTPEFEQVLYDAKAAGTFETKFGADKYHMAYVDFLSKGRDWHITTSVRPNAGRNGPASANAAWLRSGSGAWASPWFPTSSGRAFDASGRMILR